MMRKLPTFILLSLFSFPLLAIERPRLDIDGAITVGSRYKTAEKYGKEWFKHNTVCHGQICYMFYSDFEVVAAAAARANQEMRTFTRDDAEKLELTGQTHVLIAVGHSDTGGILGMIGQGVYVKHWASGNVHMVIKSGDQLIQPVSKGSGNASSSILFLLGYVSASMSNSFEFTFDLSPEQQFSECETIVIDAQAKKYSYKVNLAEIMHLKPYIPTDPQLFIFQDETTSCLDLIKRDDQNYFLRDARGIEKLIPVGRVKSIMTDKANRCTVGY